MSVRDQEFTLDLPLEEVFAENHWKKGLKEVMSNKSLQKNWEYFLDYTHCWILDSRIRAKQLQMLATLTHRKGSFEGESLEGIPIVISPDTFIEWSKLKATEGYHMLYAAPLKKLVWKHTEGMVGDQLNNLEKWVEVNSKKPGDIPFENKAKTILALELQPELKVMSEVLKKTSMELEKVLPRLRAA